MNLKIYKLLRGYLIPKFDLYCHHNYIFNVPWHVLKLHLLLANNNLLAHNYFMYSFLREVFFTEYNGFKCF